MRIKHTAGIICAAVMLFSACSAESPEEAASKIPKESKTVSAVSGENALNVSSDNTVRTPVNAPENFVLIKGGSFEMGSPETEDWRIDDETQHTASVSDFYMSVYELTQAEYSAVTGKNPSMFTGAETGAMRVYRGGGWNDFAKNMRSAYRAAMAGDKSSFNLGIRLVRNVVSGKGTVSGSRYTIPAARR